MSDRKNILREAFALEGDREEMERVRHYEELILQGAAGVVDDNEGIVAPIALMEAFARVLARATRLETPARRRELLNYLAHRADLQAKGEQ